MMTTLPLSGIRIAVFAAAAVFALGAHAADVAAGKAISDKVCMACHSADGNSQAPDFPKLAGQQRDYLAKALRDYKSGLRKNPIMKGFAEPLTTKDIENLAAFFASQPAVLTEKF